MPVAPHKRKQPAESLSQLGKFGGSQWEQAACLNAGDADAWFVDKSDCCFEDLWRLNMALKVCASCPLQYECLQAGLTDVDIENGVWGGLLPGERIALRYNNKVRYGYLRAKVDAAATLRRRIAELDSRMFNGRKMKVNK